MTESQDLLREIGEAVVDAEECIRQADAGERTWASEREEVIVRFIADWGKQILGRVAAGEVSVAELAARRAAALRALRAPGN